MNRVGRTQSEQHLLTPARSCSIRGSKDSFAFFSLTPLQDMTQAGLTQAGFLATTVWLRNFQSSKPPAPSDATAIGCAARFNLSTVDTLGLNGRRFQGLPTVAKSLPLGYTADPLEEVEMAGSDDGGLPSVRKIIDRSKQTISHPRR
jgi:hypothetical protein